jgi:hypothetical protein
MRLGPFCLATGLGMAPSIFLTAAAADVGWRWPWAWAAALGGIAALAALVSLLRPAVLHWLDRRQIARAEPGLAAEDRRHEASRSPGAGIP